jgi:hypothetical protein
LQFLCQPCPISLTFAPPHPTAHLELQHSTSKMATKAKVLVPEKVSPDGLALLKQTLDVHEKKGLSAEQLLEIIGEPLNFTVRSGFSGHELTYFSRRL